MTDKQKEDKGCQCQRCGAYYKIDIMIPDALWEEINPSEHFEGGLLCPHCIIEGLEDLYEYKAFDLIPKTE